VEGAPIVGEEELSSSKESEQIFEGCHAHEVADPLVRETAEEVECGDAVLREAGDDHREMPLRDGEFDALSEEPRRSISTRVPGPWSYHSVRRPVDQRLSLTPEPLARIAAQTDPWLCHRYLEPLRKLEVVSTLVTSRCKDFKAGRRTPCHSSRMAEEDSVGL
jgi:hypothetical protein